MRYVVYDKVTGIIAAVLGAALKKEAEEIMNELNNKAVGTNSFFLLGETNDMEVSTGETFKSMPEVTE